MKTPLLANFVLLQQPDLVRQRLVHDQTFSSRRFGLKEQTIVTIPGYGRFDQEELLAAARHVLRRHDETPVHDLDGGEAVLARDKGGLVLKRRTAEQPPVEMRLDDLVVVADDPGERLESLNSLVGRIGPAAPDFAHSMQLAQERALDNRQAGDLLQEAWNGVAALQHRAAAALQADRATTDDVVPAAIHYYTAFCGPDPAGAEPEAYIRERLPAYRKKLLERDLVKGLDICLLGALRDDLCPGTWVQHISDDVLSATLQACKPERDPNSLLAALDVALGRQHDSEFRSLAEMAISKLTDDQFLTAKKIDAFDLIPVFARVIFSRLISLEGAMAYPPYWRRMSAWMQAGLLGRFAFDLELDQKQLRAWLSANELATTAYARAVDLRVEPMIHAAEMSSRAMRCEIVGRLVALSSRHEAAGVVIPLKARIEAAVERLSKEGMPLGWALPGPMEGHRRPAEPMPVDGESKMIEVLGAEPLWSGWRRLFYFSQLFPFGPDLLATARHMARRIESHGDVSDREQALECLENASAVAAAHRDGELADAVRTIIIEQAPGLRTGGEAAAALGILTVAAAAHADQKEWAAWLEEQLAEVAARLPNGEPLESYYAGLSALKRMLPLDLGIQSRAEAICGAAM